MSISSIPSNTLTQPTICQRIINSLTRLSTAECVGGYVGASSSFLSLPFTFPLTLIAVNAFPDLKEYLFLHDTVMTVMLVISSAIIPFAISKICFSFFHNASDMSEPPTRRQRVISSSLARHTVAGYIAGAGGACSSIFSTLALYDLLVSVRPFPGLIDYSNTLVIALVSWVISLVIIFSPIFLIFASFFNTRLDQITRDNSLNAWVKKEKGLNSDRAASRINECYIRQSSNLDLDSLALKTLPACIANLTNLQAIDLSHNKLKTLPNWISELTNLQTLDLKNNRNLTSLPNTILHLPNTCRVDLRSTALSLRTIVELQDAIQQEGYAGPSFLFDIAVAKKAFLAA